jgi:hypothetical protein
MLASFFGNRTTFTLTSDGLPPAPSTGPEMGADVARQALHTEMERRHDHK